MEFTIPCSIGNLYVHKRLCDLGAGINLMPISIFRKLGIGKARPTIVTLQLADRSYAHLEECEADHDVPIILGIPFLATDRTLIDLHKCELPMRVNDQQATFKVFNAMNYADESKECHMVDVIEITVNEFAKFCYSSVDSEDYLMEQGE
ncbi:uncharacterized protein [Gossypium hirsutum]|uniref:Aspartic peptidase DDI1-type domain-containing protein n=1 Tax=Gossypium hirsutum TaxID=3635 RepID=A0A1U8PV53_GOSHI|nr:uncharacterized protein LOC107962308 [Gossypium hirsutum]